MYSFIFLLYFSTSFLVLWWSARDVMENCIWAVAGGAVSPSHVMILRQLRMSYNSPGSQTNPIPCSSESNSASLYCQAQSCSPDFKHLHWKVSGLFVMVLPWSHPVAANRYSLCLIQRGMKCIWACGFWVIRETPPSTGHWNAYK